MNVALFQIFLYCGISIATFCLILKSPTYFWPTLIVATVIFSDLMIAHITLVDELLTGAIVLAGVISLKGLQEITMPADNEESFEKVHRYLFVAMLLYFIFQSVRGMIVLESWVKVRWVGYYGMLGLLYFLLRSKKFTFPSSENISFMVCCSGIIYLCLYFVFVFLAEDVEGTSRWVAQSHGWIGGAFSLFAVAPGIMAAFILLKSQRTFYRAVAIGMLILSVIGTLVGSSRALMIGLLLFFSIGLVQLGIKRALIIIVAIVAALYFEITVFEKISFKEGIENYRSNLILIFPQFEKAERYVNPVFSKVSFLTQYQSRRMVIHDADRWVHIKVGIEALNSLKTKLFGYGYHVGSHVITQEIVRNYKEQLPWLDVNKLISKDGSVSTIGFTNIVTDTGLLGLFLYLQNFFFIGLKIWRNKISSNRGFFLALLFLVALWLPINNLFDVVLYFLLIMPDGLLARWSDSDDNPIAPMSVG